MCSGMVICVHIPRFELLAATGGAGALVGRPLALAPLPGQASRIGETSGTAEALGVRSGMQLGEALARAPDLELVAADPMAVAAEWERVARALEGIGARPELERAGIAYFQAEELYRLHGGLEGVVHLTRQALDRPVRLGAAPTRFCALAASHRARTRRAVVVSAAPRRYLACQPVALLHCRPQTGPLVKPFERLGISTLGDLAALSRAAVADRFGSPGVLAHDLARGLDTPLVPRRVEDRVWESLELAESANGQMLERTLVVLVDRLLARPEREGRSLRAVVLGARLVGGGTWREHIVFRQGLSDRGRIGLALSLRLMKLPAPANSLWLSIESFGPRAAAQTSMLEDSKAVRMTRLREAVTQTRVLAGPHAALRVVWIDPDSSVPERRAVLTPFPV
jgi:protein ImuB